MKMYISAVAIIGALFSNYSHAKLNVTILETRLNFNHINNTKLNTTNLGKFYLYLNCLDETWATNHLLQTLRQEVDLGSNELVLKEMSINCPKKTDFITFEYNYESENVSVVSNSYGSWSKNLPKDFYDTAYDGTHLTIVDQDLSVAEKKLKECNVLGCSQLKATFNYVGGGSKLIYIDKTNIHSIQRFVFLSEAAIVSTQINYEMIINSQE